MSNASMILQAVVPLALLFITIMESAFLVVIINNYAHSNEPGTQNLKIKVLLSASLKLLFNSTSSLVYQCFQNEGKEGSVIDAI